MANELRTDVEDMNLASAMVTFVRIEPGGKITQDHTTGGKREMLRDLQPKDRLLAAWTGRYYTDLFELDPAKVSLA